MPHSRLPAITSPQNPRIKNALRLSQSRRHRDRSQQTVVEGRREVRRCLAAGIQPAEAFVCPALLDPADGDLYAQLQSLHTQGRTQLAEIPQEIYAKLAVREGSGGIFLVVPYTSHSLDSLSWRGQPFLVVVEGGEKPGNIGAILRTADAAGVDALIVCGGGTDLHNPNVIRASLGTRFALPCVEAPRADVIAWLAARQIAIFAATPDSAIAYTGADYTGPTAIVTGSEAHGLSDAWLRAASQRVVIPMYGVADSLNLAASTAILLYEVVRQRSAQG